jgi:hypothetical protein
MDETRTICGLNRQNSDLVHDESFINPLNTTACDRWVSSTSSLGSYSVLKNDGVPFGNLENRRCESWSRLGFSQVPLNLSQQ